MKARCWLELVTLTLIFATVVACGGGQEEKILPGPSVGGQSTSGGSGATAGGGAAGSAGAACPAFTPDSCPGSEGKTACVSLQDDPSNCGACGTACMPQGVCVAGECQAPPQELGAFEGCGDVRLAIDAGQLYWTERNSGRVVRIGSTGTGVVEIATAQLAPSQVAADANGVYWFNAGDGSTGSSKLMKAPLPLGSAAPVALVTAPGAEPITGLAVADGKLYYGLGHDVHAISVDPSDTSDLVVGVAYSRMDTREPVGVPNGISVHDGRVYWVVTDVGSVESDDLLPGPDTSPRVGHSGELWPNDLGFAGAYVYYAAFESLYAAQPGQPALPVASSNDSATLTSFAVNASNAYFSDESGHLSRHELALPATSDHQPTPSLRLARDQGSVTSVVLDSASVYWASTMTSSSCAIRKMALQP